MAVQRDKVMGWALLCNGVLPVDETGEVMPDGRVIAPRRPLIYRGATV